MNDGTVEARSANVLRIITRLNIGGPARQAMYLSGALPAIGFPSELLYGSVGPGEGEFRVPDGVPNLHVPTLRRDIRPVDDASAYRALGRIVRSRRPRIVHTHLAKAGALGRLAARRAGVPVIVHTFHGHVLDGYFSPVVTRGILEAERRLARFTDALVAVSESTRDELLGLGVGDPERWRVIPLGLELDPLLGSTPDRGAARRSLGLPENGPVVGIVGRLVPIKDHRTFLRAAARVLASHPDATFVVAGDGELRDPLEARAAELLGDRCRFLGWVGDLPTLYGAMDVVVLTSRNEGTPVALIEAGAAARAVVATDVGGVREVVRDGDTGSLAPAKDDEALAVRIGALLDDEGLRRAMGEAGRAWVRDRFAADRLAGDVASLYRELLERKGLGPRARGDG